MAKRGANFEQKRQEILTRCLDLFVHQGFVGTSTREITGALGLSTGLLFHYFPNKEKIYEELIAQALGGLEYNTEILGENLPPLEILSQVANSTLEGFRLYPQTALFFLLLNQARTYNSTPDSVRALLASDTSQSRTIEVIRRGQDDGSIRAGNPAALSLCFWSALQGVSECMFWYPDSPIPEGAWVVDMLK